MRAHLQKLWTTRRRLVLAGAAGLGVGVLGLATFALSNPRDLVVALLQRALPGVRLDRASASVCADRVLAQIGGTYERSLIARATSAVKLKGVRALAQLLGMERVAAMGPFEQRLEEITRMVITEFLPHSNFFEVADPMRETIYYYAPEPNAACGNPFADLSPPA